MKFSALFATAVLASGLATAAHAADPEYLRIIGTDTKFVARNAKGEETVITRVMTPCAKNKGWIQAMIPVPGVTPVRISSCSPTSSPRWVRLRSLTP